MRRRRSQLENSVLTQSAATARHFEWEVGECQALSLPSVLFTSNPEHPSDENLVQTGILVPPNPVSSCRSDPPECSNTPHSPKAVTRSLDYHLYAYKAAAIVDRL